ncbi:MAG: SH3 domain-containing protein, partial [Clostridia bacterium]
MSEESVTAYVHATSGSTVRLRAGASTKAIALANVPLNSAVKVLEQGDKWSKIVYGGKTGYMMSEFLASDLPEPAGGAVDTGAEDAGAVDAGAYIDSPVNESVADAGAGGDMLAVQERLAALEARVSVVEKRGR